MTDEESASATPWEQLDVQLARVRQFVLGDIVAAGGGFALLTVFYIVWQPAWAPPVQLAVLLSLAVLVYSLTLIRDRRLGAAVVAVAASFWFVIPAVTFVLPPAFIACSLGTVWPVLLSTPYVDRTTLLRMAYVTVPVTLISILFAMRGDPYDVEETLGTTVMNVSLFFIGLAFISLTLLMIWAYNSRLQETLHGLAESNAKLTLSERVLEEKVTDRTSELASATAYLSAVIDNLGQGLITVDHTGRVQQTNAAFCAMFGVDPGEVDVADLPSELRAVVERPDGGEPALVPMAAGRVGKAVATTFRADADSPHASVVVLVDDVTVEREVDRMKTEFISTVSHELRTPLTSVLGFAKIIQRRLDEKVFPHVDITERGTERAMRQVDENLEIILSEGGRLTALINDVLDISKMEARQVEWQDTDVDVAEVIETAVRSTSALFVGGDVEVVVDLPDALPTVRGDKQRLVQVFINLLSNAQKFTPSGTVTIRAAATTDDVEITVADTGVGVAEVDLPLLFERFRQVGDNLTDRPQGTGLGLPICREIVERHGGTIDARSRVGEGTEFVVLLPALTPVAETRSADTHAPEAAGHGTGAATVLVVDDDLGVRSLLRDLFETEQYRVIEAASGAEALELAGRHQPDLITLDVLMPGMSGVDTALALRTSVSTASIPLVFVSVLDRIDGASLGVDAHITKPIDSDRLLSTAAQLLQRRPSAQTGVLVVDATPDVLASVIDGLERFGYEPLSDGASSPPGARLVIANGELDHDRPAVRRARFRRDEDELVVVVYAHHHTDEETHR